ncbi:MAG: hypothetical protein QOG95_4782 [Mycobacterium sp.]|jgi:hypothetical protein|nr:hypothetical protein [Mycobacterium sp.]
MDQAGKSARGAASPRWEPGVSNVLGTLPKLAAHANDVLALKSGHAVAAIRVRAAIDPVPHPRAAFRIDQRPTLGEG